MRKYMDLIHPAINRYAEQHTTPESGLRKELAEFTMSELEYSEMLSGPLVGQLLRMLVRISRAERILEIGTFTGYSALTMAEALPEGGELITLEMNDRYEKIARSFFRRSQHGDKINLLVGPALETLEQLDGPFDLVFLDADKVNYPRYYEETIPRLSPSGVMVIDNVFWSGEVLNPEDEKAEAIHRLNGLIQEDGRVEQVLLTVRDGLNILIKRR